MDENRQKPLVIVTGASGNIGSAVSEALRGGYRVIGFDISPSRTVDDSIECDLTSGSSLESALAKVRAAYGGKIAAVIHLAAYFDFTGEDSSLYRKVTIEGTRRLLGALQDFEVGRFIYASSMLVHAPVQPGHKIVENSPLQPLWAYPKSKAEAERIVREENGGIPYAILRLAGVYDENTAVPTLSHQIDRIYRRSFKSWFYAGDLMAGQTFLHLRDLTDLFLRVTDRRETLPAEAVLLAGEKDVMGYRELQNRIGSLVFGVQEWKTWVVPRFLARIFAWLEWKLEPVIPDAVDRGEPPFIRPFMIDLASDHYDLDISRAEAWLEWRPQHSIYEGLSRLVQSLKSDPAAWYKGNGIMPPRWVELAAKEGHNPDEVRSSHESGYQRAHRDSVWVQSLNFGVAGWLIVAPFILAYPSSAQTLSSVSAGAVLFVLAGLSLCWRLSLARWMAALLGFWLLWAPLVFWAPTPASYLNDTIMGMLVIGFSVLTKPIPGVSMLASLPGPEIPPGWSFSPSAWLQRAPIVALAFVGFFVSSYLAAYQLGYIGTVWEPFFPGMPEDPRNGTEEIITSAISQAWPVSDAGLGALTYALEILTGLVGASHRWRTAPWLVMLFGVMIVPLGVVSITFIIIQPIVIGTWCTLCLIAAAAMLVQIPYSVDEMVATGEFLWRRKKRGCSVLRVFFTGDADEKTVENTRYEDAKGGILKEMLGGGVGLPWNLAACIAIGVWLMISRLTLGTEGTMANADHLVGALTVTVAVVALAEVTRTARLLIVPLGLSLLITPLVLETGMASLVSSVICGFLLIALCIRRGPVENGYGAWQQFII